MDGGVCESTSALCDKLRPQTPLSVLKGKDSGIYDAMNRGVEASTGDWVHLLNGGDMLTRPTVYSELCTFVSGQRAGVNFIKSAAVFQTPENRSWTRKPRPTFPWIYHGVTCNQQATFIRRDLCAREKFSNEYRICGDYEFEARLYRRRLMREVVWRTSVVVFKTGGVSTQQFGMLDAEAREIQARTLGASRWLQVVSARLRALTKRRR